MCGFQSEVRGRGEGLTALFLMPHTEGTPYLRFLAGGHLRKAPGNIAKRCLAVFPFSVRGQSITVFTTRPDDPRQSLSFVWEERERAPRTNKTRGQRGGSETLTFAMIETYGN